MHITLCYSPAPRQVQQLDLEIEPGSTVAQVLALPQVQSWLLSEKLDAKIDGLTYGIWNAKVEANTALQSGDRLEIYRPLLVDPKVARRERFAKQGGAKTAGLFKKRRPGAKAGY